ncbi:MAG TPA: beta-ketoacyl synthase N-terminal-like domain-containing protein [Planctomycetaceae bacterium]|nr:beta-ketoacyl synthase N-terminal-like domain-containing protein [Planctomycetaceae bacterium]
MARAASPTDVVITGVGVMSPIGVDVDTFCANLASGKSGISTTTLFPGFAAPDQVGGQVKEFTDEAARKVFLKDHRKNLKAMCREIQLGVASAMQALQNSKLDLNSINHERLGVEFGANLMLSAPDILAPACDVSLDPQTHQIDLPAWGHNGLPRMEPLWLLRYLPNMPACHISIASDARGPSNSLTLDDASGNTVLGEAQRILQRGAADIMITGCTGTTLHPIKTMHLALYHELATTPEEPARRCRPFDQDASGRVVAEGACTFILETRSHAEGRGAPILGRVLGTGGGVVTTRDGEPLFREALVRAMQAALRSANISVEDIGHINAHGLGIKAVDQAEALAIHDVFGPDLGRKIPVTALKGYFGNSGAGSGTLELAASLLSLRNGVIPMTLNYEHGNPDCPLNVVHGQPLKTSNKVVLNLNVTRIGQATAAIVEVC